MSMSMWRCVYRRGCAPTKCTRRHSSRILLGLWRWRLHFIECLKSDGVLECSDSNQSAAAESDGRDGAPRKEKQRRYVSSLFWRCKCLLKPLWQLLCGRIRRCGRRRRRGRAGRHGRRRDNSELPKCNTALAKHGAMPVGSNWTARRAINFSLPNGFHVVAASVLLRLRRSARAC